GQPAHRRDVLARQADVLRLAVPGEFLLNEKVVGLFAPGQNRAAPAFGFLAGDIFEHPQRPADQLALRFGLHIDHELVLEMAVSGNLVTALDGLANGIGIKLGAGGIGTDRARRVEAIENAYDAPE